MNHRPLHATHATRATHPLGRLIGAAVAALGLCSTTSAHVVLDESSVTAGASYRAVFRVGHGCNGSATHTLVVRLPAGFRGAKPSPKAGWALSTRTAPLAEPYDSHGRRVTEDVVEVRWQARTPDDALPDAHYDEFVLRGQAPAQPGALWFKVLQQCTSGEIDWADVPAAGTSTRGLKAPAALLQVRPAEAAAPHQH